MSPPELPATQDPFELLGVSHDADPRELKRAYVRLIKVFRPDEHPEQFDRVRRAFEVVRAHLERARVGELQAGDDVFAAPAHDPVVEPMGSDAAAPPRDPSPRDVPSPLGECEGDDLEARVRFWQRGIEAGLDMSRHADSLSLDVVQRLSTTGTLDWERLRAQPNRDFAVWLYRGSVPLSCAAGRSSEVLRELLGRQFEADRLSTPALESALWRALTFAAWDDVDGALAALQKHQPDASADAPELEQLDVELVAARTWSKVRERARPTEAFERALRYGVVPSAFRDQLGLEVADDLHAQPERWLCSIDALCSDAPLLSQRMLRAADGWVEGDDRVWDELTDGERDWLSAATGDLDRALKRNGLTRLHNIFTWVLIVIVALGFFVWGWWGLASLLVGALLVIGSVRAVDRRLYPRVVRPLMIERFVMRGISPERMVEAIAQNQKLSDDMSRFDDTIEQDTALYVLAALQRVRLERGIGPQPTDGMRHQAPTLTGSCVLHPERAKLATCVRCQKELCGECREHDVSLGDYCVACRPQRMRDKRQHHLAAERDVRALSSIDLLLGAAAIGVASSVARNGGEHVGVFLAAGGLLLLASLGMRVRVHWGRIVQLLVCLPALLAFPIGTFWGGSVLVKLNKRDFTEVFTEGHAQARAATPEVTLPRVLWLFDAVGIFVLLLSLLSWLGMAVA